MATFASLAAVLLWVAAIHRLVVSLRGPATLWRWSFTVAVLALAAGSTALALGSTVDTALHVNNIGTLLIHITVGISAGSVTVYLLTLRADRVRSAHITAAVGLSVVALLVMGIAWAKAPFHSAEYPDLAFAPLSGWSVTYFATWYAYLTCVLAITTAWCRSELQATAHQRRSVRVGLSTIGISTGIGAFGFILGMTRVVVHASTEGHLSAVSVVSNTLYTISLTGIAIGTVFFVIGPHVERWRHHRTLLRDLAPLAARIRQLYPAIVLDEKDMARQPATVRAQRLVIEISDGLRLLPVRPDPTRSASQVIADTLAARDHPKTGSTANDLLHHSPSQKTEHQVLVDIAACYSRSST